MTESEKLFIVKNLEKYISKNLVKENLFDRKFSAAFGLERRSVRSNCAKADFGNFAGFLAKENESLLDKVKNLFSNTESTFQERLFEIIRERKIDEVELYTKAQITKQTFSKIRSNKDYKPTKNTAFLLVLALNLNLEESQNLLSRAGIAFSPSDKFDLAIKFFIENKIYDIFEINEILLQSGIRTLAG